MIQAYFAHIKATIDKYAAANFVLDSHLTFETRPGNQGYVHGHVVFVDESRFFFREYLDAMTEQVDKLMYTYHYQDASAQLVFRYDNAQHRPALPFNEHKHLGDTEVIQADAPALTNVLAEIAQLQEWI